MKTKYIGVPRDIYNSKYRNFIKSYFEYLGYNIVLSKENINININSIRCSIFNKYISYINDLKNKCDVIVVPYIYQNCSKETICPVLENIHTIATINTKNILTFNLKHPISIINSTLKINKNILKIITSYILAKIDYLNQINKKIKKQIELLKNTRRKILIVTNEYYEENISIFINPTYDKLYSNHMKEKTALDYYRNSIKKTNIYFIKLILGSIYYYQFAVDKIIIINHKKCKYKIKEYLKFLPIETKEKIIIINI